MAASLVCRIAAAGTQHDHQATSAQVETIRFDTTCKPEVRKMIERGIGLLHAFWFDAARDTFGLVAHADVDCAIAWWGIALSYWGDPFDPERSSGAIEAGADALRRAAPARHASARERMYLQAVAQLFQADDAGGAAARAHGYWRVMDQLSAAFPDDVEASVFAALARAQLADSANPADPERLAAAEALESLWRLHRGHAGIAHYLTRVLDHPALAGRALDAAREYRETAPPTSAALLAPARIFLHLGLWDEALESALASADAARRDGDILAEIRALEAQVHVHVRRGDLERAGAALQRAERAHQHIEPYDAAAGGVSVAAARARYAAASRPSQERGERPPR